MTDEGLEIGDEQPLPEPDRTGSTPLSTTMENRRSRREFDPGPVSLSAVSQVLWAAQGQTHPDGLRTAPSAGATYPLVVWLIVAEGGVPELTAGIYRYQPHAHQLVYEAREPVHGALQQASYDQEWVGDAPIIVAIAGIEARTAQEYGSRAGDLYVPMEAGHAGQNLHLQVEALDLATVSVGGFEDGAVADALSLTDARPLVLYPIGQRATH